MKIYFNLTKLNKQNPSKKKFYKKVFDIVGKWWEQAVWIKDDREKTSKTIKEILDEKFVKPFNIPESKGTYEDYDLLVHAYMAPNDGSTFAFAGPMYRHPDTQRPITGEAAVCWYGDKNFHAARDGINRAIGTMIHEFGHVMAFMAMDQYHPHFVKYDKVLKEFLWTGLQVKERAQTFYGCKASEMKGLALEMLKGKPGAHWNEEIMNNELMTPYSGDEPEAVSPMMMGFMEDSFWYKSDYKVVEHYRHNLGDKRACTQKYRCPDKVPCKLGTKKFITDDYKGLGYCSKDEQGCPVQIKYSTQDITQP